ncbi:MAG: hypothetical protein ACI4IJ_02015 [Acutalibacteraceae bacterium]
MIDTIKDLIHGVRNKQTVTINLTITVVGLIIGFFIGVTQYANSVFEAIIMGLLCAAVCGSIFTFVINFACRWWQIIKFGLDKEDIGWILGCIALGGIFAICIEAVLAIFRTIKTIIFDTKYLVRKEYQNE